MIRSGGPVVSLPSPATLFVAGFVAIALCVPEKLTMVLLFPCSFLIVPTLVLRSTGRIRPVPLAVFGLGCLTMVRALFLDANMFVGPVLYWVTALGGLSVLGLYRWCRPEVCRAAVTVILAFCTVEVVYGLLIYYQRSFPDRGLWTSPFVGNEHAAGIVIGFFVLYLLGHALASRNVRWAIPLALAIVAMYQTEAKQADLAFVMALLFFILYRLGIRGLLVAILLAVAIYSVNKVSIDRLLLRPWKDIPKVQGYARTLQAFTDDPFRAFWGFGPGNYASRAAVARSDPLDLAKQESKVPSTLVYTPDPLSTYLADLYKPSYYAWLSSLGVTGTYYTPFSSLTAIVGEFGLVGVGLFFVLFWETFRIGDRLWRTSRRYWPLATVLCVSSLALPALFLYDNWLEYPKVILTFAVFVSYGHKITDRVVAAQPSAV